MIGTVLKDMYSEKEIITTLEQAHQKYEDELTAQKFNEDDDFFTHMVVVNRFGSWSAGLNKIGQSNGINCPNCGKHFETIGKHWKRECEYPKITSYQKQLLIGGVMGDANFLSESRINFGSTTREFLEWLDIELDWLSVSSGVSLQDKANESYKQAEDYFGKQNVSSPENYSDSYYLRTREHPKIAQMKEKWYQDGKKRYPSDLSLTSTSAKIWYVGDGGLSYSGKGRKTPNIQIASANEKEKPEMLKRLLKEKGFSPKVSNFLIYLPTSETEDFLEWIGEPVPGFEYKWATNLEEYKEKKPN